MKYKRGSKTCKDNTSERDEESHIVELSVSDNGGCLHPYVRVIAVVDNVAALILDIVGDPDLR